MAYFRVPNSATLHTIRAFLFQDEIFDTAGDVAVLEFHPKWAHLEPVALSMIASWGAWCRRQGKTVEVRNLEGRENYPARMRLFEHLGIDVDVAQQEREEVGRILPVTQVATRSDIQPVIANISALLHLDDDPESLAAVQYCISELLRNVLEHSDAIDGAFVCAHRFTRKPPHRVSIAVADCGQGIAAHLGRAHPDALTSDRAAPGLAMRPGVTGAQAGIYGTPDNAGPAFLSPDVLPRARVDIFQSAREEASFVNIAASRKKRIRYCSSMPTTTRATSTGNCRRLGLAHQSPLRFGQTRLPIMKASSSGFLVKSQAGRRVAAR